MKKLIGVIAILAMVLVSIPAITTAQTTAQVSVTADVTELQLGTDITVTVNITGVENFDAASYRLAYRTDCTQFISVDDGEIDGVPITVIANPDGMQAYVAANLNGTSGESGDGNLGVFHFQVTNDIEYDGAIGYFKLYDMVLSNSQAESIPVATNDLMLTLTRVIAGDANGDKFINALDITTIERQVVGLDPATPGSDANGDGVLNALDITKTELLVAGL